MRLPASRAQKRKFASVVRDGGGNLEGEGRWIQRWDEENRRARVMSYGAADRASWRRVDGAYDAPRGRIRQRSCALSNGVWVVTEDLRFGSDPAWFGRHTAELNATNHALWRSCVWGRNLIGMMDGAGGVGGLSWVKQRTGDALGAHFRGEDGNGNVVALISAPEGGETARYE